MPKSTTTYPLDQESLHKLVKSGIDSDVLRARLTYSEVESFAKYVRPLVGKERIYPSMLPTQSPGRWSLTDPPLVTWPDDKLADKRGLPRLRGMVEPDEGTWWLCWDWSALHARFTAAACDDRLDLEAFEANLDIHTLTACQMFGLPMPPSAREEDVFGERCVEWRQQIGGWGKGDRRRHLAKTVRYALLNALDERGVMESKEVEEQGLTVDDLLRAARAYLRSKPGYVAWKRAYIEKCLKVGEARSLYGRRLKLFGPKDIRAKQALSHFLQGTEVDILDQTLIEIQRRYPETWLAYPSHDGVKWVFGEQHQPDVVIADLKPFVERRHQIGRHNIALPAEWDVLRPGDEH